MSKLLNMLAGCALVTQTYSQEAIILPESQGLAIVSWNATVDKDLAGYRVYLGTESKDYTNSCAIGNNVGALVKNLNNNQDYYFAVSWYDEDGVESPFSEELRINMGPKATVHPVNLNGNWFYELNQTRHTSDNIFRMVQGETTNQWRRTIAQKIQEVEIDVNTYSTTWLIPASNPIAQKMYFKHEALASSEDLKVLLPPKNIRVKN